MRCPINTISYPMRHEPGSSNLRFQRVTDDITIAVSNFSNRERIIHEIGFDSMDIWYFLMYKFCAHQRPFTLTIS